MDKLRLTLHLSQFTPLAVIFILVGSTPGKCDPISLQDAYVSALKNGETVRIQTEVVEQAHEGLVQAKGAIFPQISGSGYWLTQQQPTTNLGYSNTESNAEITADQPLFRGLREWATLRQRHNLEDSSMSTRLQAGVQLLEDTATAFYNVLMYEQDVRNYDHEIAQTTKEVDVMKNFKKIGRSRETDVLTLEASLASLEASKETSVGALEAARKTFAYLTALPPNSTLADDPIPPPVKEPLQSYLDKVETRPDVKSAAQSLLAAGDNVDVQWGQHLPSADLIGDYYFTRPGALQGVNWDVEVTVTVPIFSGGVIQSQVRQAKSQERQADLTLSSTRRAAVEQVATFYVSVLSDEREVDKLMKAADLSNRSYEAEVKDFSNGLVTTLDVLTALNSAQENERLLDRARYQLKTDWLKLQASINSRKEIALIP